MLELNAKTTALVAPPPLKCCPKTGGNIQLH